MIFGNLNSLIQSFKSDPIGTIIQFLFLGVCILTGLILHECAHGFVALKCGDPTAKMRGRLTLNPAKHLDLIGTLCMVFVGVGWAKPVPVNPSNFRNYRRDYILVSLAGIITNFLIFLICLFGYVFIIKHPWIGKTWWYMCLFLQIMARINIGLAIFNLIPVPPLDGYRVLNQFAFKGRLDMNPRTTMIIHYVFLAVCISGVFSNLLGGAIDGVVGFFERLFAGVL